MVREAIVNASPLIFLARGGHLDLLRTVADRILVPAPVINEIVARGESDRTASSVRRNPWIEPVSPEMVPDMVREWGLGVGESAVLALALKRPGTEVIMDDLCGRKCAVSLGIRVRGTLGIVLLAKKRGLIPSARDILDDLIRGGMYLTRDILDRALQRVGE